MAMGVLGSASRHRAIAGFPLLGLATGVALLFAVGCDDVRRYGGTGVVQDVRPDSGQVIVDHEEIRGLMGAMTMSFDVPDKELLASMRAGQEISFTVAFTGSAYQIVDAAVLGMVEVGDEWARLGDRLIKTMQAADFELTDQDGAMQTRAGFGSENKALLLDFIFTQCPGPCPLLTSRAVAVQRALPAAVQERIQFVSISLDPRNDTPEAFRKYGAAHGVDFANWSFLGGTPEVVDPVVRSYAVGKSRNAEGVIEHLVVAMLVNENGRILKRYLGTSDDATAIAADLVALTEGGASVGQ
jgi:protein SCO1/2